MTASLSTDRITERITAIQQSIPATVRLIAVTKKMPSTAIRAAYAAGIRDFGESRLQEALEKQDELSDLTDITWHLIGHLQTNKARKALAHFQWIHSLDSLKLARKLNQIAAEQSRPLQYCLQVKMVPDPPKYGFDLEALWSALPELNEMSHLNIVGLMTIPPLGSSLEESQHIFEQARHLAQEINDGPWTRLQIRELSMGMSGDYRAAIAAGATMIRLGTHLFGDRPR